MRDKKKTKNIKVRDLKPKKDAKGGVTCYGQQHGVTGAGHGVTGAGHGVTGAGHGTT